METLKTTTPVARKEHECMFCGGAISIGEKYDRQTNLYDGTVYDWVCHTACSQVACHLNMYDDCDDGLNDDGFKECLNQYVYHNHYDEEIDDIAKDWQLPYPELVKKVLEDFNNKETINE